MSIYFSSGRSQFSELDWCFTLNPTEGNLSAGNYYFSIQGRNRIGLNKPLKSNLISIPSNSTLTITLNPSIYKSGENWFDFIISISEVDNLDYFKQILSYNIKKTDGYFSINFPINIVLNKDSDIEVEKNYCSPSDIDDTEFLNGKVIKCLDTNYFYEFYKGEYLDEDEINTNNFNTNLGCFKRIFTSIRNVTNIEDFGGCNLHIRSDLALLDYYRPINYTINNTDSEFLKFTIANKTAYPFAKNSVINILSFINGQNGGTYLEGSIFVTFKGFINLTTGELRTTDSQGGLIDTLNIPYLFNTSYSNLFLPDTLNPNEGFILDIHIKLNPVILSNIFTNNTKILIYPIIYDSFIKYSPLYEMFTDGVIVKSPDYCLILPQSDGNIIIKKGEIIFKGYSIYRNYEEDIALYNNSIQYLNLDIENNLQVFKENETLPPNSINIARLECLAGKSQVSNKLKITLTSQGSLNFKFKLPLVNNKIKFKSSYPKNIQDLSIYNIDLPTTNIEIYIEKPDQTIVKVPYVIDNLDTQDIDISTLPLNTIEKEDINYLNPFGLINPPILEANDSSIGLLPAGTYTVYCSFIYSGVEVTSLTETLKVFDLDNLGSNSQTTAELTKINAEPNLVLNLEDSVNYEILLNQDCNLEDVLVSQVGSTINLIFRQDEVGNHTVTFSDKWKFPNLISNISKANTSVTILKGFVYENGIIYCSLYRPYYDIIPIFGNDFQLNNLIPLNNGVTNSNPPINNDLSQLLNDSQLLNTNQLNN